MSSKPLSALIPTTQVWDSSEVTNQENLDDATKEILVRMYQKLGDMAQMVNYKETGMYSTEEFICGKSYFPNPALSSSTSRTPKLRQVIRKVINWVDITGASKTLPNASSDSVPHGITFDANTILTRLYGAATDHINGVYIPLPYVAPKDDNIALWATNTDIWIETFATDRRDFTIAYVVIEFLKF